MRFEVFLVDDGSTDGTGESVRRLFPRVNLIRGNGNLYWCGGMRMAWEHALNKGFDAYLWLNDDTELLPGAIRSLLDVTHNLRGIVVGTCKSGDHTKLTYGGRLRTDPVHIIEPKDYPQECELINGNIVLVPSYVSDVLGNLSSEFVHTSGDNDYGLRALKAGFKNWIAPGYAGICEPNPPSPWTDSHVPVYKRLKNLYSPKGQPPREFYIYSKRHHGYWWPIDMIKLFLRVLFPGIYSFIRNKYTH